MTPRAYIMRLGGIVLSVAAFVVIGASFSDDVWSEIGRFAARDPGVRSGPAGAGGILSGLTGTTEERAFGNGREQFGEVQSVQGVQFVPDTELGLGPRFNLDSCAGCHAQPDIGGTSPAINPQVEVAKKEGARNDLPPFIKRDGPVREARFKHNPDGTAD